MKVYVVFRESNYGPMMEKIFSTKKKAETYIRLLRAKDNFWCYSIEEMQVE